MAGVVRAADGEVIVLPATGVVDNVMAGYLEEGVRSAADAGAPAVVIKLNTPGGQPRRHAADHQHVPRGPVPVIVWVAPSGGRAASAGTFITLAANLAYMAPGHEHRGRLAGRQQRRGHPGHPGREGQERRDRQHHLDRRGPRPARRLGGVHGLGREVVHGERGRRGGRRRRHRGDDRRGARPGERPGRSRSPARPVTLDLDGRGVEDAGHEPAPGAAPPAVRPEHRLRPVHDRRRTGCSSSSRTPTS